MAHIVPHFGEDGRGGKQKPTPNESEDNGRHGAKDFRRQQGDLRSQRINENYIARLYVWAFFIVIGIVFLVGILECFSVDEYTDMLVTISGVLSGPLGFIVGYYFKASKE